MDRGHIPSLEPTPHSTGPLPAHSFQEQHFIPNGQRISSAPNPPDSASTRPQVPAYVPSSTPAMAQVALARPPLSPSMQRPDLAARGPLEPPLRSAPLYSSQRANFQNGLNDNGIYIPESSFHDRIVAVPNPVTMGPALSYHRVPAGSRTLHYPGRKSRPTLNTRGPIYVGPSNDARILEQQGGFRGRIPLEESIMNQPYPHRPGLAVPYPRSYPPVQQFLASGPPPGFPPGLPQGSRHPAIGPSKLAIGAVPSETDSSSTIVNKNGESAGITHTTMARPRAGMTDGSHGQDHTFPIQPFTTPTRHNGGSLRENSTVKRHGQPDMTPKRPSQRTFDASSPLSNRFPHDPNRPFGGQDSTHLGGQIHPRQSDENAYPLSDRKVWIGGLRPEADIELVALLLDPWKPSHLKPTVCKSGPKWDRAEQGYGGYTFAEYENGVPLLGN